MCRDGEDRCCAFDVSVVFIEDDILLVSGVQLSDLTSVYMMKCSAHYV